VITRGQNSILFQEGTEIKELAVQKVSIVDTLGAGDIFHGAFCYYYMTTASLIESLVNASIVAGKSCQFFGTREWMTK
jgi:sugar/nucleoside kinase (ribokinase family)